MLSQLKGATPNARQVPSTAVVLHTRERSHRCPTPSCRAASTSSYRVADLPEPAAAVDVDYQTKDEYADWLAQELSGMFETGTITRARYSPDFVFEDPLVRLPNVQLHQLQLTAFRALFAIKFDVHHMTCVRPSEYHARFTMTCRLRVAPWRPPVVLTGKSIFFIDPASQLLLSQTDLWDAVSPPSASPPPSPEALLHLLQQLTTLQTTPDIETPQYSVLRKRKEYEIRRYKSYRVAEVPMEQGDTVSGGSGFNDLAAYTLGRRNAQQEYLEMTTPVFTRPPGGSQPPSMAFVVEEKVANPPVPLNPRIRAETVGGGVVAARSFSGWPLEWEVQEQQRALRGSLLLDGWKPKAEWQLARYNDPFTPPFLRRNEVLIEVEEYEANIDV